MRDSTRGSEGWAGLEAIWDATWETRYLRIHRVREVNGFQSERFDGGFGKLPQRLCALIRGHDRSDNRLGLGLVPLGHEIDRANGCAAG
jgi:hypothetical protein